MIIDSLCGNIYKALIEIVLDKFDFFFKVVLAQNHKRIYKFSFNTITYIKCFP